MSNPIGVVIDTVIILILFWGLREFRNPRGARVGNVMAALAMLFAMLITVYRYGLVSPNVAIVVIVAFLFGSAAGWVWSMRIDMLHMPSMIAFQNGAGGAASFLVSFLELTRAGAPLTQVSKVSGIIGIIVGAVTFSGSIIAAAKLANKMKQTPTILPAHNLIQMLVLAVIVLIGIPAVVASGQAVLVVLLLTLLAVSLALGVIFTLRIGGADMPVVISFLNACSGLAAALVGLAVQNGILIASGATVAASGCILSYVMCKAMNRDLMNVFLGIKRGIMRASLEKEPSEAKEVPAGAQAKAGADRIAQIVRDAKSVVIVPGYGMALAHAQFKVVELMKLFEGMGKTVKFAIHPVAGRMPGHMNVLLAEADVPYDKLYEMDDINSEFPATDVAIIVGACDVVNPAAIHTEGTPISGMPILNVHEAKHVIVCNLDERPGYSGVENPLYKDKKVIMLLGDAKETMGKLVISLEDKKDAAPPEPKDMAGQVAEVLREVQTVVIVPGYGMALAHAQFKVVELMKALEQMNKEVKFAIHPVAGRMPGHMNVLLAEADVPYDQLYEMDDINPVLSSTDLVLIVGACDVVNPAAIEMEGTPISGMPIINAHEAKHVIVCNLDERPGYSGVENPLYKDKKVIMLLGDAKETMGEIIGLLSDKRGIAQGEPKDTIMSVSDVFMDAKSVVIVPGYGMALAHAQFKVVELMKLFEGMGKTVKFAIHPVAGRMPGHMNVLLAEADVPYDKLYEMDDINSEFPATDVAIIVGACDVVNPAAIHTEGTPISGMPILNVHEAKHVIVCNLDERPGYSGVENPLYKDKKVIMLLGDAKETMGEVMNSLDGRGIYDHPA